jgi:tRNA 2-thiouridine synthesizing protein C
MKNVLILATKVPYGTVFSVEGFLAAMAIASMDIPTDLVLIDEGIYCGLKGQKPEGIGHLPIDQAFGGATEFNIKLYVHKESLDKYGLDKDKLVDAELLDTQKLKTMVKEAQAIITF